MADEVKIIRLVIDSSKAVEGGRAAQKALEEIEKSTSSVDTTLARMERTITHVATILKAQLVFILYDIAMRLKEMAVQALEAVGGLDELAEQLGITANGLQALQYSAAQSGIKLEQLETGVAKFSQKIGEAAGGSKEMIDALNNIGVKILDVQGKLRPTETLMSEVAAAIIAIDDPAKRAAASVEFFGRAGTKFQPVLQDLARGFGYMGEQARAGGAMVDEHVRKRLDEMGDASERAKLKIRAFFAETAVAVLDAADKAQEAMKRNQEASKNSEIAFRDWMDGAISNMAGVGAGIVEVFRGAVEQIIKLWIDGFNSILAGAEAMLNKMASIKMPGILGGKEVSLFGGVSLGQIPGGGASASDYLSGVNAAATNTRNSVAAYYAAQRAAQDGGGSAGYGGPEPPPGTIQILPGGSGNPAAKGGGDTKKQVDEIAKLIEKIAKEAERARDAFITSTETLVEQNEIAALELKLIGEAPEVRARELAVVKATNDARKAGIDLESQAFKDRLAAVETGERLKSQAEELKRSQELWTEPLKTALQDIQRIGADAFDQMLESGKISFEGLRETFSRILRRMAAEFLALATIRPVMSVLVNAISPSMAQSMGLGSAFPGLGGGSSGSSGSSGGGLSGGGLGGLFGGGFSSALGDFGSWLNTPFTGPYAGISPGGMAGVPTLSPSMWDPSSWGITPLGAAGALAGAGMGVYQLLSGGGSASSTIGGISSIVGAGLSLIPGIGPFLGAGVSILGNVLPGLFGVDGVKQPITNQTAGQLSYGSGGWYTTGGAWGPDANASSAQGPLGAAGSSISSIFDLLGGVKNAGNVWGMATEAMSKTGSGWDFNTTSSYLVAPGGGRELWRMNEDNMMDTGAAQVARRSILGGAVGDISANLRAVVEQTGRATAATLAELATAITEVMAFDDAIAGLNKTVTTAEAAILQIDASFAAMYATAEKYGLSVTDVDAAKAKARTGYATDFGKGISRGILELTDPKAAALADLADWRTMMVDNNKWLIENVTGALDQINDIERLYGLRRAAIVEAGASQALSGLADVIKRLTYGDLSGASSAATFSGLQGTYSAMLAKANTGDATAIAGLGGAASDLAQFAGTYYGTSTPQYQSLRGNITGSLSAVYLAQGGSAADLPSLLTGFATISAQFAANEQDNAELKAEMAELAAKIAETNALMQRIAAKIAA